MRIFFYWPRVVNNNVDFFLKFRGGKTIKITTRGDNVLKVSSINNELFQQVSDRNLIEIRGAIDTFTDYYDFCNKFATKKTNIASEENISLLLTTRELLGGSNNALIAFRMLRF